MLSCYTNGYHSKPQECYITLSNIEIAADILGASHACLAEAKSHSLTGTLVFKALQAGQCWDDIKDMLHLKLCNANVHTYMSCFMEIQQGDNETLAAYPHCFKTETNRYDFNSNIATISIFVKGLLDAHNIMAKIYEKDSHTLSEVIKLVEKFNMVQQVTSTLTPPTVNMMSNDDRCFVCGKTGNTGHHCPSAQCFNCQWLWSFCPGLYRENYPIRNTSPPQHIIFLIML